MQEDLKKPNSSKSEEVAANEINTVSTYQTLHQERNCKTGEAQQNCEVRLLQPRVKVSHCKKRGGQKGEQSDAPFPEYKDISCTSKCRVRKPWQDQKSKHQKPLKERGINRLQKKKFKRHVNSGIGRRIVFKNISPPQHPSKTEWEGASSPF